jgi:hypothetical protein
MTIRRCATTSSRFTEGFGTMTEPARIAPEDRYRNALLWIRTLAGMHYYGGAFDPEHMRAIANLAGNALAGKDLPDCEERARAARARAREMAAHWSHLLVDDDSEDDDDA